MSKELTEDEGRRLMRQYMVDMLESQKSGVQSVLPSLPPDTLIPTAAIATVIGELMDNIVDNVEDEDLIRLILDGISQVTSDFGIDL